MADYVLSAKGTYDGTNFDSGIENSKTKLSGFVESAKSVADKVRSSLGDAFVDAADTVTSSIGTIGAGVAGIAATGGITRALNMERAQAMFRGLKLEWSDYEATINDAVDGTAFSMDAAALVAANLAASGVSAGNAMERSLNGATGMAATFGADLADIGGIYQKIAAQGKLSGEQLAQLSDRGINGLSVLAGYLGKAQDEVRGMVTDGEISFQTFSDAMYGAFGESAKGANNTFVGVTSNIRSNIAKIGEIFASPALSGLQRVFAALLPAIKSVRSMLTPLSESFSQWIEGVVPKAVSFFENLKDTIDSFGGDLSKIPKWVKMVAAAIGILSVGSLGGLIAQIPIIGGALGGLFGKLGGLATPVSSLTGLLGKLKQGFTIVSACLSGPALAAFVGVIALIGAVVAAFADLMLTNEGFRSTVMGLVGDIGASLAPAFSSLAGLIEPAKALFESIKNVVEQLAPAFLSLVLAIAPVVSTIVSSAVPIIGTLMGLIGSLLEQITGFVTPIIQGLATFIGAIMPYIQQSISIAMQAIHVVILAVMGIIQAIVTTVWPYIQEVITTVMAAIQSVIDVVWPHIQMIIKTALGVIQAIVDGAMAAVNGDWQGAWEKIKTAVSIVWGAIKSVVSIAINAICGFVSGLVSSVIGFFASLHTGITTAASTMWNNVRTAFSTGVTSAINVVKGIPGQIMKFFSNAGEWLVNSGKSIIDGLVRGVQGAVGGAVKSVEGAVGKIRNLFPFSPAKEGPFSGKGWVLYSGMSIMDAMGEGAQKHARKAIDSYRDIAGKLRESLEMGDVFYGFSVDRSSPNLPSISYGNSVSSDNKYGVEDTLGGLYAEVAELRSTLGRTIAENAPVVVESEREANRRYRRAAYA